MASPSAWKMEQWGGSFPLQVATVPLELTTTRPYPVHPPMTEPSVCTRQTSCPRGRSGMDPSGGRSTSGRGVFWSHGGRCSEKKGCMSFAHFAIRPKGH